VKEEWCFFVFSRGVSGFSISGFGLGKGEEKEIPGEAVCLM
jgi:hypothetical protein